MKITAISDTHGQHRALALQGGDLLIHSGDVSKMGRPMEIEDFLDWFRVQPYAHKVFIAGNHDFFFEQADPQVIARMIPGGVTYLNDSGCEVEGFKLWGSPITPWFHDWAFNRDRGAEIKAHWDGIPGDTDILVTHGPPFGILDETVYSKRVGCEELLLKVYQVKPRLHLFGHIHEDYGQYTKGETVFINASVLDDRYELVHGPVEISLSSRISGQPI